MAWWWYMASSACELVWVALPTYFSLLCFGRLELKVDTSAHVCAHGAGGVSGEASSETIQRPVLVHLLPWSTMRSLYRKSTPMPNLVNLTSRPALHSFTTDISNYLARPGMMWQYHAATGSSGMSTYHVWVVCTWSPAGNMTEVGLFATFLLCTGVPKANKWLVAPESNMAHYLILCRLMSIVWRVMFGGGCSDGSWKFARSLRAPKLNLVVICGCT